MSVRRQLEGLRSFGTDGWLTPFFMSLGLLYCFIHALKNVKDQLYNKKFPEAVACEIADDIIGNRWAQHSLKGLWILTTKPCFMQSWKRWN